MEIVAADRDDASGRQAELAERGGEFADVPLELGIGDGAAVVDECHGVGPLRSVKRDMIAGGRAGRQVAHGRCAAISAMAARTRAMTPVQSPGVLCRNSRSVGYHGLSSRPRIQRQSGFAGSRTNAGRPSAPAKCTGALSMLTMTSRAMMAAARSAKSAMPGSRSRTKASKP